MTILADRPAPFSNFLDDLTPDSGLALRRWTLGEFQRMASSTLFGPEERVDLVDGEVVERGRSIPRPFSREEYYSLAEHNILRPDERTELIYGRIITRMSPMSRPHSLSIAITADALEVAFGNTAAIEDQLAIRLDSGLEPQPDVVVLHGSSRDYLEVPRPADVLLLVEVSLSTLQYDRSTKSRMYAESGIADYWIVNVNSRKLEVYRQPVGGAYLSVTVYTEQDAVAPLAAPNAVVRVADLLPLEQG